MPCLRPVHRRCALPEGRQDHAAERAGRATSMQLQRLGAPRARRSVQSSGQLRPAARRTRAPGTSRRTLSDGTSPAGAVDGPCRSRARRGSGRASAPYDRRTGTRTSPSAARSASFAKLPHWWSNHAVPVKAAVASELPRSRHPRRPSSNGFVRRPGDEPGAAAVQHVRFLRTGGEAKRVPRRRDVERPGAPRSA